MPYTPPAQQSPGNSKPPSPALSRSQSYLKGQQPWSPDATSPTQRHNLPRSTGSSSYLSKHRRSPSLSKTDDPSSTQSDPSSGSNGNVSGAKTNEQRKLDPHGSLHQSPVPVNKTLIPTGAMMSPPESPHNSSDEEENMRGRSRGLENLAELQAAIRIIEQRRTGSPNRTEEDSKKAQMALDLVAPYLRNDKDEDQSTNDKTKEASEQQPRDTPPLSRDARKISHSRSSTDSNIVLDLGHKKPSTPQYRHETDDEEEVDSDESSMSKPPMVRKKSGELVRPALRGSSKRRPSSMPGTPTFSKAVHFDSHLEHVRHFLQVDKPAAVSAGSSPVEAYDSEIEFPFGSDNGRTRGPPFEWKIRLSNFPDESQDRKGMPVHVERVFLSADNKNLIGSVAVQNLAWQKHVTARFTLDYWKTTSEVVADFNNDVRRRLSNDGLDHFNFSIALADQANLENKTLFFCVRYNVNGQEHWDSNNSMNYQVDFAKKSKPQNGKNGAQGANSRSVNSLPRSRPSTTSAGSRPKSMASFDDFATGFDTNEPFDQSPLAMMGESPIRLKGPRQRAEIVPDAPTRRVKNNSQAFGTRYDFGASLNAAIQSASTILGDQSGLSPRPETKQSSRQVPASSSRPGSNAPAKLKVTTKAQAAGPISGARTAPPTAPNPSKILSEKPSLQSSSYQELVDKYCFFGSSKSSPQLTKSSLNMVDGANDDTSISDVSVGSVSSDGSSTPTPPRSASPTLPAYSKDVPVKSLTPDLSRSSSPIPKTGSALSSRTASPVSFGYPYHQPLKNGFLSEPQTPTAIRG